MTKKLSFSEAAKIMRAAKLEPLEDYCGNNKPWKCKCMKCDRVVSPRLSSVKRKSNGCGYCSGNRVDASDAIKIMMKASLKPLEPFPGSKTAWKCKCMKCGQVSSPCCSDVKRGTGCGICAGVIVIPELAVKVMMKANLKPLEPYPGGSTSWKCKCLKCGKEVSPKYHNIKSGDGGCKYCGGNYVSAKEAEKLMLVNKLKPLVPYVNTDTPWKCLCLVCNSIVKPRHHSIKGGQGGCPICANKKMSDSQKLSQEEAISVMKNAQLTPLEDYKKSDKPWKCRCDKCLKVVYPRYSGIQSGQGGCLSCAGKMVDPKEADSVMRASGFIPLMDYPGSNKPWKCKCKKCGRVVSPHYTTVKGGGGCRYCTELGIDYTGPGFIYLMTHPYLESHKIGIGGSKRTRNRDRVKDHQKSGWKLYQRKDFKTADEAFQVEQSILDWFRLDKKLGVYLSEFEMPQGGYSETVDASEIDLPTIWEKVEELSRVKR